MCSSEGSGVAYNAQVVAHNPARSRSAQMGEQEPHAGPQAVGLRNTDVGAVRKGDGGGGGRMPGGVAQQPKGGPGPTMPGAVPSGIMDSPIESYLPRMCGGAVQPEIRGWRNGDGNAGVDLGGGREHEQW